jgi:hypothetical protein
LQVPDSYPTIQSAIDEAVSSDEVIVQPGTYYENINFAGKSITVRSVNPNDPNCVADTIINGSMPAESATDLDGEPRILDNRLEMGSWIWEIMRLSDWHGTGRHTGILSKG